TEREFQNMFAFAEGFEAATLKGAGTPSSTNGQAGQGQLQQRRQIIGFAKFRTRRQAAEAVDILSGRKIDPERPSVLKAEMAKKNLHTRKSVPSSVVLEQGPPSRLGMGTPTASLQQQQQPTPPTAVEAAAPVAAAATCMTTRLPRRRRDTRLVRLRNAFSRCPGFKRLQFRNKSNGPIVFVEFVDTAHATRAMQELYGHTLGGLVKGGIRLSYSKNPLGVRSN
ncbi:hypothetical protein BJY59DRAFT_635044, partial [Rhodotorula toruloides]